MNATTEMMDLEMKEKMLCNVCGKEIFGEYLQANVDENMQPTENGAVMCSESCAQEYEKKLPFHGKPIQHWSRITGYYQNVEGWNIGKQEELKERMRYGVD